jgi:hypothetical protein
MVAAKQEGDLFDAAPDPAFQQSEENVFFAFEIGVEGPPRISRH